MSVPGLNVRALIHAVVRRERKADFVWGATDCIMFCAAVALEIIGRDPIPHLRGRYDSEVGAKRIMVESGWQTLGDVAASLFKEIPVSSARAGDWAFVVNADGTESLGVVVGAEIVARGQTGLALTILSQARRAFRVL